MSQYSSIPLCVDLDGTLVQTNTLFEGAIVTLKKNPLRIFPLIAALFQGKEYAKHKIGSYAQTEPMAWLFHEQFLTFLKNQHKKGRKLILATASDTHIATRIAHDLGIFDEVIASTIPKPVNAATKYQLLEERFGKQAFSYAGNSRSDIAVWAIAKTAIIVNASESVVAHARKLTSIEREFPSPNKPSLQGIIKEIRIHQWLKNLLLFVAPVMAHVIGNPNVAIHAIIGFLSFSFFASSMYVLNDLLDIPSDRLHPIKKMRPIALGTLSAANACVLAAALMVSSFALAYFFLPGAFIPILLIYFAINMVYSFRAKKLPYIDIIILAGLYVLRIVAGSAATGVVTSSWLFFFAGCFFLCLASMKRVTELLQLKNKQDMAPGRGYKNQDVRILTTIGIASSISSWVVLGLYVRSDSVTRLYTHPNMVWLMLVLIIIWIIRMWYLALTKRLPEDPVLFTSKDPASYLIGAAIIGILFFASA